MTDLTATWTGTGITAAAVDSRMIRGRIVPYGVPGATSAGLVRIRAGALQLPADPRRVIGLRDHSPTGIACAVAAELTDGPEGLDGAFRVARTPVGDQVLAEADPECQIRGGLSVELSDVEFDPTEPDLVTSARLRAVAFVPMPAYDDSRVTSVAASLHPDPNGAPPVTSSAPAPVVTAAEVVPAATEVTAAAVAPAPAAAPFGLPVTNALAAAAGATSALSLDRVCELHAAYGRGERSAELQAALSDVTYSANPATRVPEYAGELWSQSAYTRRYVPLCTVRPLRAMKGTGWRWVTRPEVQDYAGDKAPVPSNEVATQPVDWTAQRVAGAWDVDRAYYDFGDTEFYRSFYSATTDSYKQKTDNKVLSFIIANAVDATTLSDDYDYVAAAPDVLTGAAVLSSLMGDLPTVSQQADFVLMNTGDLLGLMKITGLDLSAFLTLLGVDPGKFRAANRVPKGRLIAGTTTAVEYRELGDVPIRVEAVDLARGGIDSGVFGYCALFLAREHGLLSLPINAAAPVG